MRLETRRYELHTQTLVAVSQVVSEAARFGGRDSKVGVMEAAVDEAVSLRVGVEVRFALIGLIRGLGRGR